MGRFLEITIKRWPRVGAWTGTLKNPSKSLWRWEPDRMYNFFFNVSAHMCRHKYDWNIVACDVKHQRVSWSNNSLFHDHVGFSFGEHSIQRNIPSWFWCSGSIAQGCTPFISGTSFSRLSKASFKLLCDPLTTWYRIRFAGRYPEMADVHAWV